MWASAPTGRTAFLTEGKEAVKGVKTPADAGKADVKAAEAVPQDTKAADSAQKTTDKKVPTQKENLPELKFTDAEIQSIQNIGRKSVNNFNARDTAATEKLAQRHWEELGEKSPFYRAKNGDWRETEQTAVQIATKPDATRGVQKNTDTGWDIQVSGKVFNETKVHTDSYNVAARPYLPYINDIVKNAVLLDSNGLDPDKPKSKNSMLMHSMYAVADIGKGPEVLKLYVEEMNDPNSTNTIKRCYQLQNTEKYRPTGKSSQKTASSISPVAGNNITVADLYAAVKAKDGVFRTKAAEKPTNRKVGWDGRVVAKDATGPSVTVDGKKYEFLGYDDKGVPVYQDAQVLREQEVSKREKEQQEDPQQKSVVNPTNSDTMKLPDIQIGRSLGAKAKNYQVMDLSTGEMFNLVEGTNLQNVEAFAGKGTKTQYRNAYKYADAYGGKIEDWQHVKGNGWIAYTDGDRYAEIHWSQCEGIGKYDLFIKRWKDES